MHHTRAVISVFVMDHEKNQIVFKRNIFFLGIGILILVMFFAGVCFLISLKPLEDMNTFMDYFGLIFIAIWLLLLLLGGMITLETNSKQIIINYEGISSRSWFTKDFILWSEVADWGLSYCGQTKGEGNTYYLYFSKHICPDKNDCRKKLTGKMVKTFIFENEYEDAVKVIIPFCNERTSVKPFIGEDRFHFLF
jgi:hypothetical protein